jgi:hypothetical protein
VHAGITIIMVAKGCSLISTVAEGHRDDKRVATIVCDLLICETLQEFLDASLSARGSTVINPLRDRYASR